jgi:6-pyruvoyltetrahydropterin/6-carboxytetrahydropterin synthase
MVSADAARMSSAVAPAQRRHRLVVAREQYKFSCAHMTVFPDGTKERLHGHNYQVGAVLELTDVSFSHMIPFAPIKEALATICADLRERVLLAEKNPFFVLVRDDGDEIELTLCGKRYVLPREDALLLPLDNIAVEPLAAYVADLMLTRLRGLLLPDVVTALEVSIHEGPGQGASCHIPLGR